MVPEQYKQNKTDNKIVSNITIIFITIALYIHTLTFRYNVLMIYRAVHF